MQFLMGLNDSYAQNRAQILMMDQLPVISKIFALVMQEGRQRSIHNDVPVSSIDRSAMPPLSSMIVAAKGHFTGNRGVKLDNRPICSHCNTTGHTLDKCYKVHCYPTGHPKSIRNSMITRLMLIKSELQLLPLRAWVTISQNYSGPKIVSTLLYQIDQRKQEAVSDDQLGELLYKSLSGAKYLIVMDEWCTKAWDEPFFPDNHNGSRIMITSRLWNVAVHLSSCRPFEMDFLDDDRTWELLSEKVFGERVCPPEFEKLGKTIAKNSGGPRTTFGNCGDWWTPCQV